jgi:hypothetical protein
MSSKWFINREIYFHLILDLCLYSVYFEKMFQEGRLGIGIKINRSTFAFENVFSAMLSELSRLRLQTVSVLGMRSTLICMLGFAANYLKQSLRGGITLKEMRSF